MSKCPEKAPTLGAVAAAAAAARPADEGEGAPPSPNSRTCRQLPHARFTPQPPTPPSAHLPIGLDGGHYATLAQGQVQPPRRVQRHHVHSRGGGSSRPAWGPVPTSLPSRRTASRPTPRGGSSAAAAAAAAGVEAEGVGGRGLLVVVDLVNPAAAGRPRQARGRWEYRKSRRAAGERRAGVPLVAQGGRQEAGGSAVSRAERQATGGRECR